jgi:hypothetical protein
MCFADLIDQLEESGSSEDEADAAKSAETKPQVMSVGEMVAGFKGVWIVANELNIIDFIMIFLSE